MVTLHHLNSAQPGVVQLEWNSLTSDLLRSSNGIFWFDLLHPSEDEEKEVLEHLFHFHHLSIDDCKSLTHHPKIDDFQEYLFVIMHGVKPVDDKTDFETSKLAAFLGENYLVTYHQEEMSSIEKTLKYCLANPRVFAKGPDNVYHLIIDDMVDAYLPVLDRMDDTIDAIEDEIFQRPKNKTLSNILTLKKDVMRLRRVATHQKEILNRLSRGEFDLISEEEKIYYRDVYDHLVRIADLAETYRDLISGSLDAYLSVISNRMNEVMKTLTIIATIMLPLSLVAGIYGMNFQHMPELAWMYGYPFALSVMAIIALGMLRYFKKNKWF